jgi:hypothetical protein
MTGQAETPVIACDLSQQEGSGWKTSVPQTTMARCCDGGLLT